MTDYALQAIEQVIEERISHRFASLGITPAALRWIAKSLDQQARFIKAAVEEDAGGTLEEYGLAGVSVSEAIEDLRTWADQIEDVT